jgi:hypothetical protein
MVLMRIKMAPKKGVSRTRRPTAAGSQQTPASAPRSLRRKTAVFFEFSPCVSRACLGKCSALVQNGIAKKRPFSLAIDCPCELPANRPCGVRIAQEVDAALQRGVEAGRARDAAENAFCSQLISLYVCPEPVLAKERRF